MGERPPLHIVVEPVLKAAAVAIAVGVDVDGDGSARGNVQVVEIARFAELVVVFLNADRIVGEHAVRHTPRDCARQKPVRQVSQGSDLHILDRFLIEHTVMGQKWVLEMLPLQSADAGSAS